MRAFRCRDQTGVTLVELLVTMFVFTLIALGFLGLYAALVHSAVVARRQAVALTMATNQMEYVRSIPYDSLAVQGGSIVANNYIPAKTTKLQDNAKYFVTTSISYVDDAFDGCTNYPNASLKATYCRGYSASTTSAVDSNPADYKIANVAVTDSGGDQLASVNTELSARVAETASTTGALFITVVDQAGAPLDGATVTASNPTVSPAVKVSDTTDKNGLAIFYGLPVDSGADYTIVASQDGYSSLTTIAKSGSLQPTYPHLTILSQQASSETMMLKAMAAPSLLVQTTDTAGTSLSGAKVYAKGGYKKYTSTSDTSYYYDNLAGSDTRPTTDSGGLTGLMNVVPGPYYFCGDNGATGCTVGGKTYYLAAAVAYSGTTALNPIVVPSYSAASPPTTTYAYGGSNYLQKVQLLLTPSSSFPRVSSLTPSVVTKSASSSSNFVFSISGANLPCSATAATCSTSVKLLQGSASFVASCTGTSSGTNLSCTVNLSSATIGGTQLVVSTGNGTLTLPDSPQLGGVNVE